MKNKFLETGEAGYHPLRKFKVILSGLRFAVLHDFSVLYKVIISLLVVSIAAIFHHWLNASLIIFATAVMISAELFNTTIEAMCDFIQPDYNAKIGIIKDIAAAATGVAIFAWLVLIGMELVRVWRFV